MSKDNQKELNSIRLDIENLVKKYCEINFLPKKFIPGETDIPASGKLIDQNEIINLVNSSLDGWLTAGRFNKEFEIKLARFIGVKFLITVNSGSSANLVAFSTLTSPKLGDRAIKKGDEVITVAAGFPTTVNPIMQNGATPVFVDVDKFTHNINVEIIEKAISKKTKAIMIAHSLGNPFELSKIKDICKKYNLWLVEDCCDALGSTYDNKKVGTFGDLATLSFYPAHHITMGEGGAVFTNNPKLKMIAESFRDWGRDCYCPPGKENTCRKRFCWKLGMLPEGYDHKYIYSHMGFNLKITDMQAASGLAQLKKLDTFIIKRKENFRYLYDNLQILEKKGLLHLPKSTENSDPSWFGFPLTVANPSYKRLDLLNFLNNHKIGTRLLFSGNLTKQPYMIDKNYKVIGDLINTDNIMNNTFWIGLHPSLSKEMLDYVIDKLISFFK